jgi:hypothetical protein
MPGMTPQSALPAPRNPAAPASLHARSAQPHGKMRLDSLLYSHYTCHAFIHPATAFLYGLTGHFRHWQQGRNP